MKLISHDVLFLILKQLPISDLVRLQRVCHQWYDIIQKIFKSQKSLKLFSSLPCVASYSQNVLYESFLHSYPQFALYGSLWNAIPDELIGFNDSAIICERLSKIYPNLEQLIICGNYRNDKNLGSMLESLKHLSKLSIVSLIKPVANHILSSIGRCQMLVELNLFNVYDPFEHTKMPNLPNLRRFSIISCHWNVINILNQLGSDLEQVKVCKVRVTLDDMYGWIVNKLSKCTRLTHLMLDQFCSPATTMFINFYEWLVKNMLFLAQCSQYFTNLTYLGFGPINQAHLFIILNSLSKLENLQELYLNINSESSEKIHEKSDFKLLSLKSLYIKIFIVNPFPKIELKLWMPNLSQVLIHYDGSKKMISKAKQYFSRFEDIDIDFFANDFESVISRFLGSQRQKYLLSIKDSK